MAKRKENGSGSIKQRANGTYQLSVMIGRRPDGKRNMKYFSGSTKSEVRKKLKAYMDALEKGMNMEADYTLEEWPKVFMELHSPNIKPVTVENYSYTLKLINKHLGHRKIRELKPIDVELLLLRLREEGRSDSAISQVRGLLYQLYERAVGNDLVNKNIVQYTPKMKKRAPNEKESFTEEEVAILMELLPHTRIGFSIRILLGCGLRSQELLALMPKHIEPDGSRIHIRQAVSMIHGEVTISEPKSYDSYRSVVVPHNIRYCAIALRETDDMFIWQSPTDSRKPINPSTFRKYYKEAIEAVPGVRYLSAHACRHTYVSIMHSLGVDTATIQSMVGHSTALMTKHYLHVHASVQNDAADRFSHAFSGGNVAEYQKTLDEMIQDANERKKVINESTEVKLERF